MAQKQKPKMATFSALLKLSCALMALMAAAEAAMTCGTVNKGIATCLPYLKGGAAAPPSTCCSGIRNLKGMARTTADRRAACNCLKSTAARLPGLKLNNAAALPGRCRVTISFPISPRTDCSRVK